MNSKIKTGALIGLFSLMALGNATISGNVFADTTYTSAQFPDANFFSCVKLRAGVDDATTSITQAQAESIKDLYCAHTRPIQSTEGIQYLSNLESIDVGEFPDLASIDLSHNNKLKTISIYDNDNLKSLILGQQPALTLLTVKNTALQEIDITNAPALTSINLFNNKITSIDTSHNTNITSLVLSKNQLTDIDLSANTKLFEAYLYGNNIKYVDVSKINNDHAVGLYLDDDVLVRTNFVAVQTTQGGNYYADATTSGYMFIPMIVATGLSTGETKITTPGATYYDEGLDSTIPCNPGNPFCIIFDANILDYQNYIQLAYVGEPGSQSNIENGRDRTKLSYRLEINLEAYREDGDPEGMKVPNTGASISGENDATSIMTSVASVILVAASSFIVTYLVKRHNAKVGFDSSKF